MARCAIFALLLVMATGCGNADNEPAPEAPPGIELTSSAFQAGAPIPARYTCDGQDTSPPLAWADVPKGAKSLALVVDDPDAPGGTYTHWTVYGIPAAARRIQAGATPPRSQQGQNSFGDDRYGGPCPPKGDKPHHYEFELYALRAPLGLQRGAKPDDVCSAITKQALARGLLIGTFKRG